MGMTHTSKIVLLEMGFSFPLKAPIAPKAKKALLALLIASSIAFDAVTLAAHARRGLIIYTLLPELESKGFPLVQQTAYQHGVSCLDAMFSAYETLSYLTRNGNTVFQTLYDLEKTFDSVEYETFVFKRN